MTAGTEGIAGRITDLCRGILSGIITMAAVYAAAILVLMLGGIKPYIVMSGSMEPTICTGSLCLVYSKAAFESIAVGDVIAFETAGGSMVTHRVIGISDRGMETKGDANDVPDGYTTTPENFRGKTVFSIPYLGYVNYAMNSQPGKIICMILFLLLLAADILRKVPEPGEI
ncbi:MAG: signal peptidase I [Lachnospiraceae bacterium]|nr:signal peptidase I [Lachnospiraceae bacterium]